jgi:hypothetical protein
MSNAACGDLLLVQNGGSHLSLPNMGVPVKVGLLTTGPRTGAETYEGVTPCLQAGPHGQPSDRQNIGRS